MIYELVRLIIFILIVFLVYYSEMRFLINRFRKKANRFPFTGRLAIIIHILAIIGILCFVYGYFIEPYWIEVKPVDIATDKIKDIELKIVQISDLHCDKKLGNEYKLIDIVNQLEPDVIVFTGDTLNTQEALPLFKEIMKKLKAKIAKFAIRGNFDVWYWSNLDLFSGTGFELLEHNTSKLVKDGEVFYVSGLGYGFLDKYHEVLRDIPDNNFSVFLHHYPDLIEKIKGLNVDLYLAGHVHGGQVALPVYGALITFSEYGKKYERGKYVVNNTILYSNRGIGMEGGFAPRVRFWSRPEITVFNIKAKGQTP